MAQHNELGKKGEQIAVQHLLKKGYAILERNYTLKKAEIDIIAQLQNTLVVIEVKARSTNYFGTPQDFVKPKQIKNLVWAIDQYIKINALEVEVRFDIIAITLEDQSYQLEHLEDAFYHFL